MAGVCQSPSHLSHEFGELESSLAIFWHLSESLSCRGLEIHPSKLHLLVLHLRVLLGEPWCIDMVNIYSGEDWKLNETGL